MFGDWEVNIIEQWQRSIFRVYLYKYVDGGVEVLGRDGVAKLIKDGEKSDDDFFFAEMTRKQLQALANSMAQQGIKTTNDSKNEGLLIATKEHLADMRKLVFKEDIK